MRGCRETDEKQPNLKYEYVFSFQLLMQVCDAYDVGMYFFVIRRIFPLQFALIY